ncbi:MAG: hypothetical protein HY246_03685 [Proteobacteria bacterium]|nr:hypothetical protein [Pseudomonadota bacterium]
MAIISCALLLAAVVSAVNSRPRADSAIVQGRMAADHVAHSFAEQVGVVVQEFEIANLDRHIGNSAVALFYSIGDAYTWLRDALPKAAAPFDRMGLALRDGLYYTISLDWLMLPDPGIRWPATSGRYAAAPAESDVAGTQ